MLEYRRKDLDLSTRIFLGIEMLSPVEVRGWGRASELAEAYGISRSLLPNQGSSERSPGSSIEAQTGWTTSGREPVAGRPGDGPQSDCRDAGADGIGA